MITGLENDLMLVIDNIKRIKKELGDLKYLEQEIAVKITKTQTTLYYHSRRLSFVKTYDLPSLEDSVVVIEVFYATKKFVKRVIDMFFKRLDENPVDKLRKETFSDEYEYLLSITDEQDLTYHNKAKILYETDLPQSFEKFKYENGYVIKAREAKND